MFPHFSSLSSLRPRLLCSLAVPALHFISCFAPACLHPAPHHAASNARAQALTAALGLRFAATATRPISTSGAPLTRPPLSRKARTPAMALIHIMDAPALIPSCPFQLASTPAHPAALLSTLPLQQPSSAHSPPSSPPQHTPLLACPLMCHSAGAGSHREDGPR